MSCFIQHCALRDIQKTTAKETTLQGHQVLHPLTTTSRWQTTPPPALITPLHRTYSPNLQLLVVLLVSVSDVLLQCYNLLLKFYFSSETTH